MKIKISVIVPAYNEESVITRTLEDLLTQHRPEEVLVVDGGSTDRTVALASAVVPVLHSEKGRAHQMNTGAEKATGNVFLFLHADTRLPPGGLELIRKTLETNREAGRFRLQFDHASWSLRLFAAYTRFHFFSYGDQGFFITRPLFQRLHGFDPSVPFEDVDFYKRLSRLTQPVIVRESVQTSARRFLGMGSWRQKWINLFLVGMYYAGFDVLPHKARWYPDIR